MTIEPTGQWCGHDRYECPHCGRDSLDAAWMEQHIATEHPPPKPARRRAANAPAATEPPGEPMTPAPALPPATTTRRRTAPRAKE